MAQNYVLRLEVQVDYSFGVNKVNALFYLKDFIYWVGQSDLKDDLLKYNFYFAN